MKRREFVGRVGMGSAVLISAAGSVAAAKRDDEHDHRSLSGPLASATVSFGAWPSGGEAPLDRTVTPNAPAAPNVHQLLPHVALVKEGGSVNFIVAGFHHIVVYGPGTKPTDIDRTAVGPLPDGGPPLFINDPENRIYRGISPVTLPQDRVEVVQFPKRGLHLVICAFRPHFDDNMYGWVRVIR